MSLYISETVLLTNTHATDYCIVAFGIILLISTIQWIVDGRKNFTGPRTDMSLEVLEAMKTNEASVPADADPKLVAEIEK